MGNGDTVAFPNPQIGSTAPVSQTSLKMCGLLSLQYSELRWKIVSPLEHSNIVQLEGAQRVHISAKYTIML